MLPLRDDNPTRSTAFVTIALVVINILVFIYEFQLGLGSSSALDGFIDQYAFDYTKFVGQLQRGGLTFATLTPLFTHMFLHANWLHVGGNMLYLWIFGNNIEDRLGPARYLFFYLACGVAAAIGQGIFEPSPMIGASGAVAGVLGAYLVLAPRARVSTLVFLGIFITVIQVPAVVVIGFWFITQLISALGELQMSGAAGVAFFAHVAGFLTGIVLLFLLRPPRQLGY